MEKKGEKNKKINPQSQARPQKKIIKKGFESLLSQFSLPSKWIIFKVQRLKMITFQVKRIA